MKKPKLSRTVLVLKRLFNLRAWADWDRMRSMTLYLISFLKKLFIPADNEVNESFATAQARLNLSNADLIIKQKSLLRLSFIMLGAAILLFIYAIYHLLLANFLAFGLSLVVMLVALTLAFRYHFWSYQIKIRKLGCTIHEWFKQGLMGDKP